VIAFAETNVTEKAQLRLATDHAGLDFDSSGLVRVRVRIDIQAINRARTRIDVLPDRCAVSSTTNLVILSKRCLCSALATTCRNVTLAVATAEEDTYSITDLVIRDSRAQDRYIAAAASYFHRSCFDVPTTLLWS
jgi:hypothetical protein